MGGTTRDAKFYARSTQIQYFATCSQRCHHNLHGRHDFNDIGHDKNQSKASTTANPIEADVKFKRMPKSIKAS